MIYAPVIIPTLNRDVHLKRCIESLQKNKLACLTELFISLDYPPAEKYAEGYQRVKKFLDGGIEGFKAVYVYTQERNLGAEDNYGFLLRKIEEAGYDRYIYSEDDNEFSANFLEYMDTNLAYFEKDEKALGVCAAQKEDAWYGNGGNIVLQHTCPAYGLGIWMNKNDKLKAAFHSGFMDRVGADGALLRKLRKRSNICFREFMSNIVFDRENIFWDQDGVVCCDTTRSIYAMVTDDYYIAPLKSKCRNWGFDGSGLHMKKERWDPREVYPLDEDEDYELRLPEPLEVDERNTRIHNRQLKIGFKKFVITYLLYGIFLFYGRDYRKCICFKKSFPGKKDKSRGKHQ